MLIGGGVGHDVDDPDDGGDDVGDDDGDLPQAMWTVWRLNVGVVLAR